MSRAGKGSVGEDRRSKLREENCSLSVSGGVRPWDVGAGVDEDRRER